MKRIGIVSVQNNNYGSILQAYALQKVLFNNNYDNEIILYKKSITLQLYRLLNINLLKNIIRSKAKKISCKIKSNKIYNRVVETRENSFETFKKSNLVFSSVYKGEKSLKEGCKFYNNIMVGSDQVWHPLNLSSRFYSLIFVPDEINKISYASSFGVAKIPFLQIKKSKEYLSRIPNISVREEQGKTIIKKLINKESYVVLDPTLLLGKKDWDKIKSDNKIKKDYIFCYFIGKNIESRKIAQSFAINNNLEIVVLPHIDEYIKNDEQYGTIYPENVGPSEFIALISNAKYIFTDSYHATIFSIIYNKNFFVFERFKMNDKRSTNNRIYSLLDKLGLTKRICHSLEEVEKNSKNKPDYTRVCSIIEQEKNKSIEFLKKSIK